MTDISKLKRCLAEYRNAEVAKKDIVTLLQKYKGLKFNLEKYVFNDGAVAELVNLSGTIPVQYKGSVYNIPICIWLMTTHPTHAPLCYVRPTQDMTIKASRNVDHNGRIYLPYLHEWNPQESNLIGLVRVLCTIFGQTPPVFTVSKNENTTPYPTNNFMPLPGGGFPPSTSSPYPAYPNPGVLPYPAYPYPMQPQPSFLTPYPPQDHSSIPQPQGLPYPTSDMSSGGTITEEHIKASLLSAVEDKLKLRLREQFSQNQAELETLKRTQHELGEGKRKLDEIVNRLKREDEELDRNISVLEEKSKELEESVSKLENQEEVDIDDAIMTTAPLYNQLLRAFSQEATTEDTIYYLGEALRSSTIDLDVFLKQVRALSRKQFTLRALMQRCRQKAGLAY